MHSVSVHQQQVSSLNFSYFPYIKCDSFEASFWELGSTGFDVKVLKELIAFLCKLLGSLIVHYIYNTLDFIFIWNFWQ